MLLPTMHTSVFTISATPQRVPNEHDLSDLPTLSLKQAKPARIRTNSCPKNGAWSPLPTSCISSKPYARNLFLTRALCASKAQAQLGKYCTDRTFRLCRLEKSTTSSSMNWTDNQEPISINVVGPKTLNSEFYDPHYRSLFGPVTPESAVR